VNGLFMVLESAEVLSTGGSFAGGLGLGLVLGLIGTGIAYAVASEPEPPYEAISRDMEETCRSAFIEGYKREGKTRKRSAALTGGFVGTVIVATAAFLYVN
jgi:hypothetical protein